MVRLSKDYFWRQQQTSTASVLDMMRREKFLTDVTLVCDGVEFCAHRSHLCAASPYFLAMFKYGSSCEAGTGSGPSCCPSHHRVKLSNVRPAALRTILHFIYTGAITGVEHTDSLRDLLHAADLLEIKPLFCYCIQLCGQCINVEYLVDQWAIAELSNNAEMSTRIAHMAAVNFRQLVNHDNFLDLSVFQLKQLLNHPHLRAGPQDSVLCAVFNWIKFKEDERKGDLKKLVECVDLRRVKAASLDRLLKTEPLIERNRDLHNHVVTTALDRIDQPPPRRQLLFFYRDRACVYDICKKTFYPCKQLPVGLPSIRDYVLVACEGLVFMVGENAEKFGPADGLSPRSGDYGDDDADTMDQNAATAAAAAAADPASCDCAHVNAIYEYSYHHNKLERLALLKHFGSPGVAVLNGLVYVVGGDDYWEQELCNSVQRVNPLTGQVESLADTNERHIVPRVFPLNDHLYVMGNFGYCVERYDTLCDQWSIVTWFFDGSRKLGMVYPDPTCDGRVLAQVQDCNRVTVQAYNLATCKWLLTGLHDERVTLRHLWHVRSDGSANDETGTPPYFIGMDSSCVIYKYVYEKRTWVRVNRTLQREQRDFKVVLLNNN